LVPLLEPAVDPLFEPDVDPLLEPVVVPLLEPDVEPLLEPVVDPLLSEPFDFPHAASEPNETARSTRRAALIRWIVMTVVLFAVIIEVVAT